jgi:hypothetical protein
MDITALKHELATVSNINVNKALLLLCENNQSPSLYKGIEKLLAAGKEVDISVTDESTGNNAVMFLCAKCPRQHLHTTIKLLLESTAVLKKCKALSAKNNSKYNACQIVCDRKDIPRDDRCTLRDCLDL